VRVKINENVQDLCFRVCDTDTIKAGQSREEKGMSKQPKTVQMVNPWSGAEPPDKCWTWREVVAWITENVAASDRPAWLADARKAWRRGDGKALGVMIIGS
jgi:hypothetical protein